jgi:hypothetical protein
MANQIDIANFALQKLGAQRISSLTQNTEAARIVSSVWNICLHDVLRARPWNFALGRALLPKLVEKPLFDYEGLFLLPSDHLRLHRIGDHFTDQNWAKFNPTPMPDYAIEGNRLLTDIPAPLKIVYIRRIEDSNLFDPSFVQCLATRIAAEICFGITQKANLRDTLMQEYLFSLNDSGALSASEKPPEFAPDSTWILSRYT